MNIRLDFEKYADGLVPAIVQDDATGRILMLGFMNEDSLRTTIESGRATFLSRSRGMLWTKGETSGNFLQVVDIIADCDNDTLLIKARPAGPVCHTGDETCFRETNVSTEILRELESVIRRRRSEPDPGSYTSSLFSDGINRIAQKVGEEAVEVVIAAKDKEKGPLLEESADLVFHLLVLLVEKGASFDDVLEVLRRRRK